MLIDELSYQILRQFGMTPTVDQKAAIDVFARFLADKNEQSTMILRGSAGTGKSSLAGAIVRMMKSLHQKVVLLAPTGRAAKVFSNYSGSPAFTIHRKIYRQKNIVGEFNLNFNKNVDTLFLVDECSMISNDGKQTSIFGTGRLLDDLVSYVYGGRNCRLMLIGDGAQLQPVGEEESPALNADNMRMYGLQVFEVDLSEVLRQEESSGILHNATCLRELLHLGKLLEFPKLRIHGFADVTVVSGDELIESLASSYSKVGISETMVVTRSNKRANIYNQGIRNMILGREEILTTGDMLMIVKNNYFWTEKQKSSIPFIANGDCARVIRVRNVRQLYGLNFADVCLTFPDYDDYELEATVMTDTLMTEAPALKKDQQELFFNALMEDYSHISSKREKYKKLKEDVYFNAVQVKYAYAVTCHKAQGGQWEHIYVDQGYVTDEMLSEDYIHWLYTAVTRASSHLFLVNWPKKQMEEAE